MHFFLFQEVLQLDKFEEADFKYDDSFFKILAQKCPNKTFLVPHWVNFSFSQIFAKLDKFDGADFKYENSFLKFYYKNTQIRHFLSKI